MRRSNLPLQLCVEMDYLNRSPSSRSLCCLTVTPSCPTESQAAAFRSVPPSSLQQPPVLLSGQDGSLCVAAAKMSVVLRISSRKRFTSTSWADGSLLCGKHSGKNATDVSAADRASSVQRNDKREIRLQLVFFLLQGRKRDAASQAIR